MVGVVIVDGFGRCSCVYGGGGNKVEVMGDRGELRRVWVYDRRLGRGRGGFRCVVGHLYQLHFYRRYTLETGSRGSAPLIAGYWRP